MNNTSVYVPFSKKDDEQRMVYGYASTESVDSQGEIVEKEAIIRALPDYLKFGNIREMHQPVAVGKTKSTKVDENGLFISVKVVDDRAWQKVKEGVYNGFSIGGRVVNKIGNRIKDLILSEISLVDRPANQQAVFTMYKAESGSDILKQVSKVDQEKLDEVYAKYRDTVNMSASELENWSKTECSKKASLDRSPIKRNIRLLGKKKSEWTQNDIDDANRTISFVSRMKGAEQGEPAVKGCPSKRDISLKNWAYDPSKRSKMDDAKVLKEESMIEEIMEDISESPVQIDEVQEKVTDFIQGNISIAEVGTVIELMRTLIYMIIDRMYQEKDTTDLEASLNKLKIAASKILGEKGIDKIDGILEMAKSMKVMEITKFAYVSEDGVGRLPVANRELTKSSIRNFMMTKFAHNDFRILAARVIEANAEKFELKTNQFIKRSSQEPLSGEVMAFYSKYDAKVKSMTSKKE